MSDNPSDIQYYERMLQSIEDYEKGRIRLHELVKILEQFIHEATGLDEQRRSGFMRQWEVLEQVYAYALFRGENLLDEEDQSLIGNATNQLKILLKEGLDQNS